MTKQLPHIELYQSPKFGQNEDLSPKEGDDDRCVCCNKPLNKEGKYFVHMSTDWKVVPFGEELSPQEDQGCFPVGNACAKKIPAPYKQK
jgi:hypothetical protein